MKDFLLYTLFALQFAIKNKTLAHVKYFWKWFKDKKSGNNTLKLALPWMTYDAIDFLESITADDKNVFEWGSGGSTLYFASRCKKVISIEHDNKWGQIINIELENRKLNNVTYRVIEGKTIDNFDDLNAENPDDYVSKDPNSKGLSFKEYANSIDLFKDYNLDIVIVDGRARNACIKRAMPHLKKNGYLIVDNADRSYYLSSFPELFNQDIWNRIEFVGPVFFQHAFGKTVVFRKKQ